MARLMLDFFKTESLAKSWFARQRCVGKELFAFGTVTSKRQDLPDGLHSVNESHRKCSRPPG